jgi:hypothetical protein
VPWATHRAERPEQTRSIATGEPRTEEIEMDLNQLDVAREMQRDRDRMLAEAFRAASRGPALGATPTGPSALVKALHSLARFAGHRARLAH